jgi:WD40 repeat protein
VLARDTHKSLLPSNGIDAAMRSWDWSPDGLFLTIGSDQGTVGIWNVETGEPITPKLLHTGWVESVQFSSDGTRLLTVSDDGTAKIWDLTGEVDSHPPLRLKTWLPDFAPNFFSLTHALSSDGKHLIMGGNQATVINTRTLELEAETTQQKGSDEPYGVAIDSTGQQWAAGAGSLWYDTDKLHNATLWHREAGVVEAFTLQHPEPVYFLEFTKDGSHLLTAAHDNILRRWQTSNGALINQSAIPPRGNRFLQFSPDGRTAALWLFGGDASLCDIGGDNEPRVIAPKELRSCHVAFSPDGLRLATAGRDQHGHIWDVRTGRELTPPFKHGGDVRWVEWSPDGTQLLTAGVSGEIKVWNGNTGQASETMRAFAKGGAGVAHFSPNGRLIVGRSDDATARVWDVSTGDPLTPEIRHEGFVRAALMVTSNRVLTVSEPGVVRAWDLTASELPVAFLSTYAQLLSGKKVTSSGREQPLTPGECFERMKELRQTHADFFAQSDAGIRRFHREHILAPFTLLELASASYHLEKLAGLDPQSPELPSLRQLLDQSRIPLRENDLDSSMIDLSRYYNASLTMSWHQGWPGGFGEPADDHDLAELPRGKQILNGVAFDVRGLIQVANEDLQVRDRFIFPGAVSGIEMNKKAKRLHFLHASQRESVPNGEHLGSYVIRYRGGRTEEVQLIYGEDLRDWFTHPGEPEDTTHAKIAWKGHNETSPKGESDRSLHLYQLAWENPTPNEEIATLDFVAGASRAHPFLIALTVDALE